MSASFEIKPFTFEPINVEHFKNMNCTLSDDVNGCTYCTSFSFYENCSFYVNYQCSNDLNLVDINGCPVKTCICNCSIYYDSDTDNHYYTYNENKTKDDCEPSYLQCKTINDFMMCTPKIFSKINTNIEKYLNEILNNNFVNINEYFNEEYSIKQCNVKYYIINQIQYSIISDEFINEIINRRILADTIKKIFTISNVNNYYHTRIMTLCIKSRNWDYLSYYCINIGVNQFDILNNLLDYYSLDMLSLFVSIYGIEHIKKLICNKFIELLNCHFLPCLMNLDEIGLPSSGRCISILQEINIEIPEETIKRMLHAFRNNIHFYSVSSYLLELFPNREELIEMTLTNSKPNMEYLNRALNYVYNDCMFPE